MFQFKVMEQLGGMGGILENSDLIWPVLPHYESPGLHHFYKLFLIYSFVMGQGCTEYLTCAMHHVGLYRDKDRGYNLRGNGHSASFIIQ